ncbi:rCG58001 [Rattus norvegicus]|uniref:RCG58001 n=1 Tax=Rattus norvegicus TaxID=10116 RepID=A6J4R4_RAT|nr:rCG58001 [Rattus norvegicus]
MAVSSVPPLSPQGTLGACSWYRWANGPKVSW